MQFENVTYTGPRIDDPEIVEDLPAELANLLSRTNGFIAFRGGFHVRGACLAPPWHSLRSAWRGPESFSTWYRAVRPTDLPFAEDALGDQFILREGLVYRLAAETGEIEPLNQPLLDLLEAVRADAIGTLGLQPLLRFEAEGGILEPGQLLSVYPPFCTKESANGVSLRAVPASPRQASLASFAAQIADLGDGSTIEIVVKP
jgi:hypothetical protein